MLPVRPKLSAGNDAALADLLAADAPDLVNTWRQTWDLEEGSVILAPVVAEGNPVLAAMLALHKESCRLLYASGALPPMARWYRCDNKAKQRVCGEQRYDAEVKLWRSMTGDCGH